MKINKFIIIGLLIISIFISSCDIIDQYIPNGNTNTEIEYEVTGVNALDIEFLDNSPPKVVYDEGDEFTLRFHLKNVGSSDINEGVINTVVEKSYIDFIDENQKFIDLKLQGKKDYYPGDEDIFAIRFKTSTLDNALEAYETSLKMNICYDYHTTYDGTICIDPDESSLSEKACEIKNLNPTKGQGAPIMINKIEQKVSHRTEGIIMTFDIYIKNKAKGFAIDYDKIDKICRSAAADNSVEFQDVNVIIIDEVEFSDYKLSNGKITCRPLIEEPGSGIKYDIGEEEYLRCTTDPLPEGTSTYSTELSVRLKYGYIQSFKNDIRIDNIN